MCLDIDECSNGTHDCFKKSTCLNTEGSYSCVCSSLETFKNEKCDYIHKTFKVTDQVRVHRTPNFCVRHLTIRTVFQRLMTDFLKPAGKPE